MDDRREINDKEPIIDDYENPVRHGNPGGRQDIETSRSNT